MTSLYASEPVVITVVMSVYCWSRILFSLRLSGGTAVAAPSPFRPGKPALYVSHPLVTPYFDTVGWVSWPVKTVSHISYTVLAGTQNHAQSNIRLVSH